MASDVIVYLPSWQDISEKRTIFLERTAYVPKLVTFLDLKEDNLSMVDEMAGPNML